MQHEERFEELFRRKVVAVVVALPAEHVRAQILQGGPKK